MYIIRILLTVMVWLVCATLTQIDNFESSLTEIWSKAKDDWQQTLVCTVIAIFLFAIGYDEVLQQEVQVGYFHMVLSLIPGAPGLRFWFNAWRDGARRTMEVH